MKKILLIIVFLNVIISILSQILGTDKCTTIAVGKKATVDGSTLLGYTADCAECDWRVNKVPAQDYVDGTMRPIYLITGSYPRQVREDHGYTWSVDNLEESPFRNAWSKMKGEIIGYIPQVSHTYAYIEGMYGISNEFQVSIGESTCAAKLYCAPVGSTGQGKALLEISELSQIALERSKTAREAIQIMGDLAEKYGFYSADWSVDKFGPSHAMGEGGEALSIIDPNESWIFHILPDDLGTGAIWVAQKVPDGHLAIVANQFIIREVIKGHKDFIYSSNLWSVAKKLGWWKESDGHLNFLHTYSPTRYHPDYANRRVWRVFDLVAPNAHYPATTNSYADDYPFSVEVQQDKLVSVADMMKFHRDHYEGTPFSTAEGLASGPYGDPNRYDLWGSGNMTVFDAMEAQARSFVPDVLSLVWFSQYAPDSSTYTPLYVSSDKLPRPYIRGTMHEYTTESMWWNHAVVGNYASKFYNKAMIPVRKLQNKLEKDMNKGVEETEKEINKLISKNDNDNKNNQEIISILTKFTQDSGNLINNEWIKLFPYLLTHYRDGYVLNTSTPVIGITRMFYPEWWLKATGFFEIKGIRDKDTILFQPSPISKITSNISLVIFILISVLISSYIGYYFGMNNNKHRYISIDDHSSNSGIQLNSKV